MTWDAVHHRGEVLRHVVAEANSRRDGALPMELPGVTEVFGGEFDLVTALQMRWHTRLAGRIDQELLEQHADLDSAVLTAWRATARELTGVREILDACGAAPTSQELGQALAVSRRKDWQLLAASASQAAMSRSGTLRAGRLLEERARAGGDPAEVPLDHRDDAAGRPVSLIGRLRAHLAA